MTYFTVMRKDQEKCYSCGKAQSKTRQLWKTTLQDFTIVENGKN